MIMMMMVTMMMMICDLIRQAAACGFPMVATACQGLGFQLGLRSFFYYQGYDHHDENHDNYNNLDAERC